MQLKRILGPLVVCGAFSVQAQSISTNNIRPISLQDAITMALQQNFDVQIQRFNPELARYSVSISYGGYDPTVFASGQHTYAQSPGAIDPIEGRVFTGSTSETDSFAAGFRGLLPTGLTYQLSGNAADSYGSTPRIDPITGEVIRIPFENATAQVGALTLTQPLLKNFWIDGTRANIYIAKNRLKHSEQAFRFQLMQTIAAVEQSYYNLIFARENVKVQEKATELSERLLLENKKKVEVGALAPLDEKQAESQVASSRADLLAAIRAFETQQNVLKNLVTEKYAEWQAINVLPAEDLVAVPEVLNLQESWNKGHRLRPDLIQARLDLDRSDINLRFDKNQLFPQLDLIGQYGYRASGQEFSRAFGQIQDMDNPFWYYGAQISYPLGARSARNNYKASKAEKKQIQILLKKKEQDVMVEIDDAVKAVQTSFQRVEATRQARLFAEAALDAEQKKLENGKSTSFFVLQFQRDLTSARFQEIRALAEYNNALAQLSFREGSTLERHKLDVQMR